MNIINSYISDIGKFENYGIDFTAIAQGTVVPAWMKEMLEGNIFKGAQAGEIMDFTAGTVGANAGAIMGQGSETFFLTSTKWTIGGMAFDGIMKTDHSETLKVTNYPIQDGSTGNDHAIINPASLNIEIMVTDSNRVSGKSQNIKSETLKTLKTMGVSAEPSEESRSARAYASLLAMQKAREPITVITRLKTYNNMLIEQITTPDDFKTANALKCSIKFVELSVVGVTKTTLAARKEALQEAQGGLGVVTAESSTQSILFGLTGKTYEEMVEGAKDSFSNFKKAFFPEEGQ